MVQREPLLENVLGTEATHSSAPASPPAPQAKLQLICLAQPPREATLGPFRHASFVHPQLPSHLSLQVFQPYPGCASLRPEQDS